MTVGSIARRLSKSELEGVHKTLIEVTRKQKSSDTPVEISMPEGLVFWDSVAQLLQSMETELSETVREEGMTAKAQLLSRRLGVARTCVRDLTRMRLTAFTRHAVLSNILSSGSADGYSSGFQILDWGMHDPSERVFYNGIRELSEKYKASTSWSSMLGSSEVEGGQMVSDVSDTLRDFTGEEDQGPDPKTEAKVVEEHWEEPDFDEEDRIREMEAFPEHASSPAESRSSEKESEDPSPDLLRIRILQDVEDPILMDDGSEILLTKGDIESCPSMVAEILISAGLAEAAPI
tara:strand:- start:850 stop:1722 length:873 start_codon:yes stop_codon:yes gene_type:complete